MFVLLSFAFAADPPIPEGCTAEAFPGGLRTLGCDSVVVTWGAGPEHGRQGALALADPQLSYAAGAAGREPVTLPGATAAATVVLTLPGIEARRVVVGYGADWMVTCATVERSGALARCLDLIVRSAPR